MREILFRGKRADNGEWIYGDLRNYEKSGVKAIFSHELLQRIKVAPETVGQYTGLKDKNGKKIFEGDIVRYPDCVLYAEYNGGCNEGVVDWCEETMCFYFTNRWSAEMEDFDVVERKMIDVEVIGDIHDNPELLKGGTDNA